MLRGNDLKALFFADIDGQADMRLIYGIIVAEEKDKLEREDKVWAYIYVQLMYNISISVDSMEMYNHFFFFCFFSINNHSFIVSLYINLHFPFGCPQILMWGIANLVAVYLGKDLKNFSKLVLLLSF